MDKDVYIYIVHHLCLRGCRASHMILSFHVAWPTRWWDKQVLFPLASVVQPVLPRKVRNRRVISGFWLCFSVVFVIFGEALVLEWEPPSDNGGADLVAYRCYPRDFFWITNWWSQQFFSVQRRCRICSGFGSDQSSRRMESCGVLWSLVFSCDSFLIYHNISGASCWSGAENDFIIHIQLS